MPRRPLHILITDPHVGGGGQVRYIGNLTEQLVAYGHRVTVACRGGSVLEQRTRETGAAHAWPAMEYRSGLRLGAWFRDVMRTRRYSADEMPDLIHVNGSQDHWVAAFANLLGPRRPLIRTRHNTYSVSNHVANRWLNRSATDYQIVVCETVCRELAAHPAFDASRMRSIHNGVDPEEYRPDNAARSAARREFGFSESDFVFGIAARLAKAKGHEFLLRAAASLGEAHPELRLLVLGAGPLDEHLKATARELGIGDRVVWAGFRNDMPHCTQAFDAGVLPSIDCDTSSFSIKEEMACELPVVVSDYGGLTEIVQDGQEGYVVPTGTVEPLAQAMARLLRDRDRAHRMGAAGRIRVLREFTVEQFARQTEEVYYHMLGMD